LFYHPNINIWAQDRGRAQGYKGDCLMLDAVYTSVHQYCKSKIVKLYW
jgi:hypothetical protein